MDKPVLSKQAFWDVDMDKIDYEKNALLLMERAVTKGTVEDFSALKKYYSDEQWCKEIIYSKILDARDASFCCAVFGLSINDFKYDIKPFVYEPWEISGA